MEEPKNQSPKKQESLPKSAKVTMRIGRIIMIPTLCFLAIFIGMIIGYVTVGNQEFSDVFKFDTWKHLFDLVFKDNVDA